MPQLHLYVSDDLAREITRRAEAKGESVSRYLAEVVRRDLTPKWPPGWFDTVVGGWQGEPLRREPEGDADVRDAFGP